MCFITSSRPVAVWWLVMTGPGLFVTIFMVVQSQDGDRGHRIFCAVTICLRVGQDVSTCRGDARQRSSSARAAAPSRASGTEGKGWRAKPIGYSSSSGQGTMVDFTVRIAIASATARAIPSSSNGIERLHVEPWISARAR